MGLVWKEPVTISWSGLRQQQVHGVIPRHVDDLLVAGDDTFEHKIMAKICKDPSRFQG